MLKFMNVAAISEHTFHHHTRSYVNPVIIQQWREHQQQLLNSLHGKEDGLVLAGVTPLVTVPSLVHLP